MSVGGFTQNYRQIVPPKAGLRGEGSQKTPLSRTHGRINLNCEECGLIYETFVCWVKRNNHHFCGLACKNAWMITKVEIVCIVCGIKFDTQKSRVKETVTCSSKCKSEKLRLLYKKNREIKLETKEKSCQ